MQIRRTSPSSVSADARSAALAFELRMPWQGRQVMVDVIDVMEFDEQVQITSMRAYWSPDDVRDVTPAPTPDN